MKRTTKKAHQKPTPEVMKIYEFRHRYIEPGMINRRVQVLVEKLIALPLAFFLTCLREMFSLQFIQKTLTTYGPYGFMTWPINTEEVHSWSRRKAKKPRWVFAVSGELIDDITTERIWQEAELFPKGRTPLLFSGFIDVEGLLDRLPETKRVAVVEWLFERIDGYEGAPEVEEQLRTFNDYLAKKYLSEEVQRYRTEKLEKEFRWAKLFKVFGTSSDPSFALKEIGVKTEVSESLEERVDELVRWMNEQLEGDWPDPFSDTDFLDACFANPSRGEEDAFIYALIRNGSPLPEYVKDGFKHYLQKRR